MLGGVLAGCAAGVTEFQIYTKAFDQQYDEGQQVLNILARAERTIIVRQIKRRKFDQFDPREAAYYLDNIDPPVTASIRASFKSLKSYNDALGALANGEAAAALSNRIGTLVTNITGAIAATEVAVGGPSAQLAAASFTSHTLNYLTSAQDILKPLLTQASLVSFRQELLLTYPSMRGLLETLRDGTAIMYVAFRQAHRDAAGHMSPAAAAELAKEREQLAGWVVLMDKALFAMEAAATAAMNNSSSADIAALSEASIELRVLAEKVKSLRLK